MTEDEAPGVLRGQLSLPPSREYQQREFDSVVVAIDRVGTDVLEGVEVERGEQGEPERQALLPGRDVLHRDPEGHRHRGEGRQHRRHAHERVVEAAWADDRGQHVAAHQQGAERGGGRADLILARHQRPPTAAKAAA